jgi:hypothetical protein
MAGINLGTPACEAIRELRGNPDFQKFVQAMGERVWDYTRNSLESPPEHRIDQTAYAKAMLDVWVAISAEMTGNGQQRTKQAPVGTERMKQNA